MPNPTTKLAGKTRPHLPKEATGFSATSTTIEDGNDAVAYARLFRGTNTVYGIPRDAINADTRLLGSPLARLTGDEFCANAESQINLLADLTSLVGSGPLTNNNTVTFVQEVTDDESPMWEQTYANFVSASSQYLSLPTAAAVQVGTSSFVSGVAFNNSTLGSLQIIFSYGSHVSAKAYWECRISSANKLEFEIWDGTTTNTITDTIAGRWQDGRWHFPAAVVDKTNSIIYFFCDGIYIGSVAVTATNTLTVSGESFYIGARKNSSGTIDSFFNGKIAMFKLVNNAADYNIPQVWNLGTREAVASGTYTIPAVDSNKRLNNKFGTPNTNGAYFYTTLNLEDGEYELQIVYEKSTAGGTLDLLIDGNTIRSQLDTYNGSTTHNNVDKTYAIKISGGRHTVKILNNGKNGSSSGYAINLQWISLIKRRGHQNGGADNFLLLGDEINERQSNTFAFATLSVGYFNSIFENNTSPANGDYTEGTLFIKGGLYRIDCFFNTNTDRAEIDLWFGNVQVLSQYDTNGGSASNVLKSGYVRLQQGRQDIRMAVNGKTGTTYLIVPQCIRAVRLAD